MNRKLGGNIVLTCSVLAQVLLKLELSLNKLLTLLLGHQFTVILVLKELLVQDTDKGILII